MLGSGENKSLELHRILYGFPRLVSSGFERKYSRKSGLKIGIILEIEAETGAICYSPNPIIQPAQPISDFLRVTRQYFVDAVSMRPVIFVGRQITKTRASVHRDKCVAGTVAGAYFFTRAHAGPCHRATSP